MWEYVRAVREVRPRWVLWENVPGALSSTHGEDFGCLLRSLDALGYGLAWRVLDAQFFGVAQRRERVFLVGRLGDPGGPCQVLFEPDCLQWNPPQGREKRKELAATAGRGAACAGFKYSAGSSANGIGYEEENSNTLTADWHAPAVFPINEQIATRARRLGRGTGLGVGDDGDPGFTLLANHPHAVACEINYGVEISGTLTARGDSSAWPMRGQNVVCMTGTQENGFVSGETAGTLTARMGKDAPVISIDLATTPKCEEGVCHTLRRGGDGGTNDCVAYEDAHGSGAYAVRMREGGPGGGKGPLVQEDVSGTIATGNDQTIFSSCVCLGDDNAGASVDEESCGTLKCGGSAPIVSGRMVVRRLMPVECERLQGFPDEWTRIPWKGRPAEECPDGPRYKAIGNSMAVPVMRWLGERIGMADALPPEEVEF